MRSLAFVLAVSLAVGLIVWFALPKQVVAPLTYDSPLKITSNDGHNVTLSTRRCNNTSADLTVSVTAFWESQDHKAIIATQPVSAGSGTIAPGCSDRGGNKINIDYLPAGTWRLRGSVCTDTICGGWFSDWLEVKK